MPGDGSEDKFLNLLLDLNEKLDETRSHMYTLGKDFALYAQKVEFELKEIRQLDAEQNSLLDVHIKRSNNLEKDLQMREDAIRKDMANEVSKLEDRLVRVELPQKWLGLTRSLVVWIGGIATSIIGIVQIIKWFKGH